MAKVLPSLESNSMISDPSALGKELMELLLKTDQDQSNNNHKLNVSIPSIIAKNYNESDLADKLRSPILAAFQRYFDVVDVKVSLENNLKQNQDRNSLNDTSNIKFTINYAQDGENFTINKSVVRNNMFPK